VGSNPVSPAKQKPVIVMVTGFCYLFSYTVKPVCSLSVFIKYIFDHLVGFYSPLYYGIILNKIKKVMQTEDVFELPEQEPGGSTGGR